MKQVKISPKLILGICTLVSASIVVVMKAVEIFMRHSQQQRYPEMEEIGLFILAWVFYVAILATVLCIEFNRRMAKRIKQNKLVFYGMITLTSVIFEIVLKLNNFFN